MGTSTLMQTEQEHLHKMENVLKKNGYSTTRPRREVLRALLVGGASAARLSDELLESLDRATVYRTLTLFEQTGIVNRSVLNSEIYFELSELFQPHHHHAVCQLCGRVIDIASSELELALKNAAADRGFLAVEHSLELRGYCSYCQ
ncbi:transcriptional repressor [Candidatus Saccharibacteria bacterium]|nr:MAG: transcriptional repressor [Candidatus Saccharibacteria bacterium]